jgi:L-lactate utilization protein LutC
VLRYTVPSSVQVEELETLIAQTALMQLEEELEAVEAELEHEIEDQLEQALDKALLATIEHQIEVFPCRHRAL